jgi:hypothetical protein
MSTPEIKPEVQPQSVEHIPEQYPETAMERAEGIKATQVDPANIPQVPTPTGAQITPVPAAPSGPSITIPSDPQSLTQQSQGSVSDATTWNAWFWLRMIKKALAKHIAVLVKGGNSSGS